MTGIPTKFTIADLTLPQIDPPLEEDTAHFAYLGAIGASLGDFLPAGIGEAPRSPYLAAWSPVLDLFAGTTETNGVAYALRTLWTRLLRLRDVIDRKAKFELFGMLDDLRGLESITKDLRASVAQIPGVQARVFAAMATEPFPADRPKVPPSSRWHVRATLHGSHPGRFLWALRERAGDVGAAHAFARGAIIGYAADLCGNPYLNSVVNGPYRNQSWRHRWISNHVDTWVWGYYQLARSTSVRMRDATVDGMLFTEVDPEPPYRDWPDVREAGLHRRLGFGLDPAAVLGGVRSRSVPETPLPSDITDAWLGAYRGVYREPVPGSGIDAAGLRRAATLAWLILWLQTSGEAIPCVPAGRFEGPQGCTRPSWMDSDGSVEVDGQKQKPPMPSRDLDPDEPELVSALITALIAAFQFMSGVVVAGILFLVAAIALAADALTDPDWDELRCHIGWVMLYFSGAINNLHDMLAKAGLGFPYTEQLAHNNLCLKANIFTPTCSALAAVRSVVDTGDHPQTQWSMSVSGWQKRPTGSVEPPAMNAYPTRNPVWPPHFVDGMHPGTGVQDNPVVQWPGAWPAVSDPAAFASRAAVLNSVRPVDTFFGNAVDVARHLAVLDPTTPLPDWDLDADPGIGLPTWVLPNPAAPRSSAIVEP